MAEAAMSPQVIIAAQFTLNSLWEVSMTKPPFTMSNYINELDLQGDDRKYYQERAKMLESLYRELIEDYDNINSAMIEEYSIQTDKDLKEHKEDIREMLKAIEE